MNTAEAKFILKLKKEKEYSEAEGKRLSEVATHWQSEYDKLKSDNELLLNALKIYVELEKDKHGLMPVFLRPATSAIKEAIKQVENK